jgi:hypothetical protein
MNRDRFNIPTAEPNIIKLMVGEFAQGIAGHASIVPADDCRIDCVNQLDETVSCDRAKWRRAGRVRSGHGVFLYKRLIPGADAPVTRYLVVLRAQSNDCACKAVMHAAHGWRHNSTIFFNVFQKIWQEMSCLRNARSVLCSRSMVRCVANLVADVPLSC